MSKKVSHKGYIVTQSDYNHHVVISKEGKMVFHSACDHPMSDEELARMVDTYIKLHESSRIYMEKKGDNK